MGPRTEGLRPVNAPPAFFALIVPWAIFVKEKLRCGRKEVEGLDEVEIVGIIFVRNWGDKVSEDAYRDLVESTEL